MKAILIGATGLVGNHILKKLLNHDKVSEVQVFTRRSTGINHPKLQETLVDFENVKDWEHKIVGNVLFSSLGTTLRAAKSKEAQYRVDHDYQLRIAEAAARNGVERLVLISSVNADARSAFFYLKMKGELEDKVKELPFHSISILRPGPLKGVREKTRVGEFISTIVLDMMTKLIKLDISPVESEKVAEVALKTGLQGKPGIEIIHAQEILKSSI